MGIQFLLINAAYWVWYFRQTAGPIRNLDQATGHSLLALFIMGPGAVLFVPIMYGSVITLGIINKLGLGDLSSLKPVLDPFFFVITVASGFLGWFAAGFWVGMQMTAIINWQNRVRSDHQSLALSMRKWLIISGLILSTSGGIAYYSIWPFTMLAALPFWTGVTFMISAILVRWLYRSEEQIGKP
jgi:hypothetical protein